MRYLIGLDPMTGMWEVYTATLDKYGNICGGTLIRSFGLFDAAMMFICARENGRDEQEDVVIYAS